MENRDILVFRKTPASKAILDAYLIPDAVIRILQYERATALAYGNTREHRAQSGQNVIDEKTFIARFQSTPLARRIWKGLHPHQMHCISPKGEVSTDLELGESPKMISSTTSLPVIDADTVQSVQSMIPVLQLHREYLRNFREMGLEPRDALNAVTAAMERQGIRIREIIHLPNAG
ncbi:MAG: hypothetical protein ACYCS8_05975 [Acidithiobacillus sp.]